MQNQVQLKNDFVTTSYSVFFVAGNPWDANNIHWNPARLIHNSSLQINPPAPWPQFSFEVRNIMDTITEEVPIDPLQLDLGTRTQATADFLGFPLTGRVWLASLSWQP